MNVSKQDLDAITEAAQRFAIGAVYVFGSSLSDEGEPADIDLAVERVPPGGVLQILRSAHEKALQVGGHCGLGS